MNSGFLKLLDFGDVVLADRGFDIGDDIALHGARLEITAFTRNSSVCRKLNTQGESQNFVFMLSV